ncbi:unnamed protein product, partial [Rotaria sp. Silwood2]
MSSSSFFLRFVLLFAIAINTFAAPVARQRRQFNDFMNNLGFGRQGTAAFNGAWQAAQTGKANSDFSVDRIPPRNLDNFHLGGQASGGIPLIYNGPKNPSLGLGGAISGAVGVNG